MAKVYFWEMRGSAVGHLSLLLSDGTYISHWPKEHKGWKKSTTNPTSLEDDIKLEERSYDEELEIAKNGIIDEIKIKSWWKVYQTCSEYNVLVNNCGQVVRKALIEGGIEDTIPWHNKLAYHALYLVNKAPAVTPNDILQWIKYVIRLHGSFFKF